MQDYIYRTDVESNSRLVQVAMQLAREAHEGQSRHKIDSSIPYITHPVMVHDLLCRLVEHDDVLLAAGLLHDALEDNDEYRENNPLLLARLQAALPADLHADCQKVYDLCVALANNKKPLVSKRVQQILDGETHRGYHDQALLKMVDKTASVLCYLKMEDDETFTPDRRQYLLRIARDVVHSYAARYPEDTRIQRVYALFGDAYAKAIELTRLPTADERDALRESFNLSEMIHAIPISPSNHKGMHIGDEDIVAIPMMQPYGGFKSAHAIDINAADVLAYVYLTQDGKIRGYATRVDATNNPDELLHTITRSMQHIFESEGHHVNTRSLEPVMIMNRLAADFSEKNALVQLFEKPISFDEFHHGLALAMMRGSFEYQTKQGTMKPMSGDVAISSMMVVKEECRRRSERQNLIDC